MDKSNQYMKILIIGSSCLGDFIINSTEIIKKLNETYENLKRFKPINKNIKYFLVEENNNYNKIINEINNFLN